MSLKTLLPPWQKVIKSSSAITTTTSYDFELPNDIEDVKFISAVSAASGTSPTLDVTLLTSYDGGTTYVMHSRFAQQTSATTRVLDAGRTNILVAGQEFASALTGGADANNGPLARHCRLTATIGGTSPSFTLVLAAVGSRGNK